MEDLDRWYAREEAKLQEHLQKLTEIAVTEITNAGAAIGQAASNAVTQITGYNMGPLSAWGAPGAGRQYRQHGGVDVVSRPTTFVAGEAGPEIAAFIPLRHQMSVSHRFGELPINVSGAGGMNPAGIQSIVYEAMIAVAERLIGG